MWTKEHARNLLNWTKTFLESRGTPKIETFQRQGSTRHRQSCCSLGSLGSETGQSTRWRTFFAFKNTVSFSGNSSLYSGTVRETCVFFSPGYSWNSWCQWFSLWGWNKPLSLRFEGKTTLRFHIEHTWVSPTDVLPWHHSFIHRPLATNWNPQNQFFNLDFCKCFIPEYTVSQTSVSPCNGSCGPVFHPAFLFGVASKEYNMGVLQLTPCTPAWMRH